MEELDVCEDAQALAGSWRLNAALCLQAVLYAIILVLSCLLLHRRKWRDKAVHVNLKLLLANIVFLYCLLSVPALINRVRLMILYRTYSNPCDLLIPVWETVVVRAPFYLYLHAFPLWHLAIAVERGIATLRVHDYERASSLYGAVCTMLVWLISLGYVGVVVCRALSDPSLSSNNSYVNLTTPSTSFLLFYGHIVLLGLDVLSAVVDAVLMLVNRQKLERVGAEYSLSRNYQIGENIAVTMHLALPLDICNTVLYTIFVALSAWIRGLGAAISGLDFNSAYEWAFVILLLQIVISLLILLRYGNRRAKTSIVVAQNDHGDVHFQHFRQQIAAP